ncbi:MAG: hypothetical protein HOW73_05945 [Polyangiaceae bacterium]|nr:hypothetical protein [Polyangiaceae bacterium]
MTRKVFLSRGHSVADTVLPPTVDSMRQRLGGRVGAGSGAFRIGAVVEVPTASGGARTGIVLASTTSSVDVFLERGIVKRTEPGNVKLQLGGTPSALARVAEQANVFATLFEGQAVHVERGEGSSTRGTLREKCRYGALVEIDGGTMLGVGFQRLWPAPAPTSEPA